jgi:hypothetical protein
VLVVVFVIVAVFCRLPGGHGWLLLTRFWRITMLGLDGPIGLEFSLPG